MSGGLLAAISIIGCLVIMGLTGVGLGVTLWEAKHKDAMNSHSEIQQGIQECELNLPRNRHCSYVIDYQEVVE